jgi:hypothetical protein
VPAAAVIPAPIAYIKVVAVKKLVVGFRVDSSGLPLGMHWFGRSFCTWAHACFIGRVCSVHVYFEKIRVFKAGLCHCMC